MMNMKETYTAQEVLELLAAISTAAFGWAGQGLAPEHEWYSVAFQDVFELRKKYDALLAQTRWIPVTERLPEVNTPVLGLYREYFDHGEIQMTVLLNYGGEGWTEFNDNDTYYTGITHWMPLPPPPKEMK